MRILVISDCHGDHYSVREAIDAQPTAKTIIFLGDGIRDMEKLESEYPDKIFHMVPGNCDFASIEPTTKILTLNGKQIMITHGHEYKVKYTTMMAEHTARRNGCDLLLYGHTHIPRTNYDDGMYIMNPGSISRHNTHTYGTVDITNGGIFCNIIKL
jgi:putative phosphoesterase